MHLGLESLEDRTPLSTGLTTAVEAPVVAGAVEIVLIDKERILTLGWPSLEFNAQPTTSSRFRHLLSTRRPARCCRRTTPLPGLVEASGTMSSTKVVGVLVEPPAGLHALVESGNVLALAQSGAVSGIVTRVSADLRAGRPLPDEAFISETIGERLPDGPR